MRRKKEKKIRKYSPINEVKYVDFRDIETLQKFISYNGSIKPRRVTGASARHQRMISVAIKRARQMAMMPYSTPRVRRPRVIEKTEK